jgi:hypothetical protein
MSREPRKCVPKFSEPVETPVCFESHRTHASPILCAETAHHRHAIRHEEIDKNYMFDYGNGNSKKRRNNKRLLGKGDKISNSDA